MNEAICAEPIDAALLADYWTGAPGEAVETEIEEHLLGCDECGTRLREIIALAESIRQLAREGALRVVLNDAFVECATRAGLRIRQYAPLAGGGVQCTVTANDDLLMGRLAADLGNAQQIDLALCTPDGEEMLRLRDVPYDAATGEVLFNQPIAAMRSVTNAVMVIKMFVVEGNGDRLLAEYTFNHYAG